MNQPVLYTRTLGPAAQLWVTHTAGASPSTPYAGNLALHVDDDATQVALRRSALETQMAAPIQWLNQAHGTTVFECSGGVSSSAPTADASLTTLPNRALGILTADCLPIVLASHDGAVCAALHAGWRGLSTGIVGNTWQALRRRTSAPVYAHLGPCIGTAQFEVGGEVRAAFLDPRPQVQDHSSHFYPLVNGKFLCDLTGIAKAQLQALGAVHISGGGWCTVSDPRLASYRRAVRSGVRGGVQATISPPSGRFATLVVLRGR